MALAAVRFPTDDGWTLIVLYVFPFLTWLAAITSAVLLAVLWHFDELRRFSGLALVVWFLLAAYCQFVAPSFVVHAVGLFLQTILAILLSVRWKLSS